MVVLMVERVPASLRGELSRWMIEPRAGVFVGSISTMVRDKLWELALRGSKGGSVTLVYSSPNEQGFQIRTAGDATREVVDMDGLSLIRIPPRDADMKTAASDAAALPLAEAE